MAILAGNIGFKISFGRQYRVFSIPWVNRNTAILCLKGRDYSSSGPVRHIPNKSRKVYDTETSLPLKGSEKDEYGSRLDVKLQNQSGMCKKSSLLDDAKLELEEEIDHDIGVRDHEFMKEPEEFGRTMQDAKNLAIELLAVRAFTAVELKKKLHGKRFPPDIIERVINNFQSRGLINDSLYAESFSRSRWSSSSWGPRRIKQALFKKGVSEADAEKAVKLVFEDGQSGTDQELKHGLSKLSMDHLYVQASKQWLRGQDVPKETRKSRIVRWLQYRGFNWGVISYTLKKLESQYPP